MNENEMNDTNEDDAQLPDLEIYVEGGDIDGMIAWLQTVFEHSDTTSQNKNSAKLRCRYENNDIPVIIVKNAGDTGYTSIWFDSRKLPWKDDIACGKAAFKALGKTVRCIESVWQDGDDPDRWFEFSDQGERIINWE